LKEQLKPEVGYVFLNKRSRLDPRAILKLRNYIKENKIDIVHAHSTSYFLAGLLKLSGGNFKLIWHDHYGESEFLEKREFKVLKKFSWLFSCIISVNTELKLWAEENLNCKNVIEVQNFISEPVMITTGDVKLLGADTDFKIICVANLRPQKDHLNLIHAFEMLGPELGCTLHLVGENPGTSYSAQVLQAINNSKVKHKIFYLGTQSEIIPLLRQADLGILSSRSEGLPLVLIEYGMAGLPVICTNVGKCSEIIGNNGRIVQKENAGKLAEELSAYTQDIEIMKRDADNFQAYINNNFSAIKIVKEILECYRSDN